MTITVLNVAIVIICLLGAYFQIRGARLEQRPCKYIKLSYALALLVSTVLIIYQEIVVETETGYGLALLVVTFNMMLGSLIRLYDLKKQSDKCGKCPYAY